MFQRAAPVFADLEKQLVRRTQYYIVGGRPKAIICDAAMNTPQVSLFPFLDASEPLRKRAPAVDEDGKPLSDFMVIIPGLKKKPRALINQTLKEVHRILGCFSHAVVFAEFNLRMNLLWVSIRPIQGIRFEIAEALRSCIPDARLVSHL